MPKNDNAPKQSSATRSALTDTKGNEPVPALNAKGQPEADKPKHDEVESPQVREKREVAAAVRSGTEDDQIHPSRAQARDDRDPDEVAADELAEQRFNEQVDTARGNDAPLPEEGSAIDLERHPEAARIDGEPVEKPKKDSKK